MLYFPNHAGWIEVIIGSMFSGKTTELMRRIDRMRRAGRQVQVFSRDKRFQENAIVSHDKRSENATYAETAEDIRKRLSWKTEIIGIDEGQFYDEDLVSFCRCMALEQKVVIVAGLDQDFRTEPFNTMLRLVAEAESVTKLNAVCSRCGNPAIRNHRKTDSNERIVIGASEAYQALCRDCYEKALREGKQEELFRH